MAKNKKINNESGLKAVGVETLTIDWANEGYEDKENATEKELPGIGR